MAVRSLITFAVVIAVQALAGCGMPAKSGAALDDRSWWKVEFEARKKVRLRQQVEAGTLGRAQLFPGGMIHARHLPPLPRPYKVAIPAVRVRVAPASPTIPPEEPPVHVAWGSVTDRPGGCVYKPVMSDVDVEACR